MCAVLCMPFATAAGAEITNRHILRTSDSTPLSARVAQSIVIAYAQADTNKAPNIHLSVAEIWKGAHEAQTLGITNGMQIPLRWSADQGEMMDGAVLFFRSGSDRPAAVRPSSIYMVRAGRVSGMTTNEFRTRFGIR